MYVDMQGNRKCNKNEGIRQIYTQVNGADVQFPT